MKSHYKKIVIAGVAVLIIISFILLTKNQDNLKVDSNIDIDKKLTSIDFTNVSKKNIDLNQYQGDLKLEGQEVFEITGELEGTLLIETTENVKLILNKVTIKSKNGPAIYIKNASNVHIEVIGENTLVDNSNYTNYEEYGTLLSHDDLYIFGSGTLNVESNKEDAIVSKDDLVIEGVTLNIKSADDGIRGKDSVTLKSGTFNIEAAKDGIKSTNIDDENKGYVLIENGTDRKSVV